MTDLKASVVVSLVGDLQRRADQYAGSLERMGQRGMHSLSRMDTVMNKVSGSLGFVANRFTGVMAAVAGGIAVRRIATIEERFIRLGIMANVSDAEIAKLHQRILETAKAPEIRVDPGEITGAIEEIIEKTGDLKFANENIRTIGLAISATGASGGAIGGILAEFQKMGMTSKQVAHEINLLAAQGKEGAFTLQNLAALGPRVVTAYTAMGRTGPNVIREMGAALQVIRQGTGSSEMAATAFEALLRTLGDAEKVKMLQSGGIQVFDPEALKKGQQVLRPINELMVEIVKVAGGKKMVLSEVFDAEAIRAFNASLAEFQRTGQMESLQKFYNIQTTGNELLDDSTRAAKAATAAVKELNATWEEFATARLLPVVKGGARAMTGALQGDVREFGMGLSQAVNEVNPLNTMINPINWIGLPQPGAKAPPRPGAGIVPPKSALNRALDDAALNLFKGLGSRQPAVSEGKEERPAVDRVRARQQTEPGRQGSAPARMAEELPAFGRAHARRRAGMEPQGPAPVPEGKVIVEVRAAPGTEAKVRSIEGRGIDADSGLIMRGGP